MIAYTQWTVESFRRIEEQKVPYVLIDRAFLGMPANFVGVSCYNDPTSIGVIDAILEAGLRVPDDIAVIGCGNLHFDQSLRVPLSSVDQQSRAIGERAGKLVLSLIEAKVPPQPKSVMLQPSIVPRASTRRLP